MKGLGARFLLLVAGFACPAGAAQDDRTITKVVKLLQDMLSKSKADADSDRLLFSKYKCYCDTQRQTKSQEIGQLGTQIEVLSSRIQEVLGSTGSLSTDVAGLKKALAANEQAQAEAEAIRARELATFEATKADLESAISQMSQALAVLSEVGADQTLSEGADHTKFMAGFKGGSLLKLRGSVQQALTAASALMTGAPQQKVRSFLQAPFTGTYTAQSGEVVGILKNMRDTFSSNLASAVSTEAAQKAAHEKFMAIKTAEHAQMTQLYNEKQDQLGANDGELASKRQQLKEAEAAKALREEFLSQLLPSCARKVQQYDQRNMLRGNEDAAISEAIAILNSDAAFATFGSVTATSAGGTGPTFLQRVAIRRHVEAPGVKQDALHLLLTAASSQHSLRLSKIAALIEAGNPFDTVLAQIQKLVGLIEEEGHVDQQKLDWCNSERAISDSTVELKSAQIIELTGTITGLTNDVEAPETGLKAQIAATDAALEENAESQKTATAQRAAEHAVFVQDVRELAGAQELLASAISVLRKYYAQIPGLAREEDAPAVLAGETAAVPSTWEAENGYKGQSSNGDKVIAMLEYVLDEAKKEEAAEREDEADSLSAFEALLDELKTGERTLQQSLATLKKTLAEKEQELLARQEDLKSTEAEKAAVEAYLRDIKPGCDFITANFDSRQANRATETDALLGAQALIKGTPAYKTAVAQARTASLGVCASKCEATPNTAECKACLAKVTVPAYCAGHPGTEGC